MVFVWLTFLFNVAVVAADCCLPFSVGFALGRGLMLLV